MGHNYIGSEHLLLGLMNSDSSIASKILEARRANVEKIRAGIEKNVGVGFPSAVDARDMTPRLKKIIENAGAESIRNGQSYIGTEHLLFALLQERDSIACIVLEELGISSSELRNDLFEFFSASLDHGLTGQSQGKSKSAKNESGKQVNSLLSFGRDLTAMARSGKIDPIIGRDSETERVVQILIRRQKNNPCLLGEPGVGKTAVVEGLAVRIAEGQVPDALKGKMIISLDLAAMIAGAKYRGEFEERMKSVMEEVSKNPDLLLFVDEIHTLIGAGAAEGAVDAANILKPALARGEVHIIGATTLEEYRAHIEKDSALERRFQSVRIGEPSEEDTVRILQGLRDKYEAHHKVKITDEAIEAAVRLSVRYITDRFLPDKAIDLIDEACSRIRIRSENDTPELRAIEEAMERLRVEKEEAIVGQDFERAAEIRDREHRAKETYAERIATRNAQARSSELLVMKEHIAEIVTQWTGVPVSVGIDSEASRFLHLEARLKERIVGQEDAIASVARAIRRGRSGLKDPKRPIGSFLFLGQTGVGKTELAKALAELVYDSDSAMIRFDMSEFMEKHSVSKLIGSPPGYVGYGEGGQLTERVRRQPYSVVLLDEIEKAHPDVFHLLLQILDDGVLTDSDGRCVDFRNTVVILTSNLGAEDAEARHLGFSGTVSKQEALLAEERRKRMIRSLRSVFPPEFLNRIDEIVVFRPLSETDLIQITELLLKKLQLRLSELGICIRFAENVAPMIASGCVEAQYGARPLRRSVMHLIEDRLSDALLSGEICIGEEILVSYEGDGISVTKETDHSGSDEPEE